MNNQDNNLPKPTIAETVIDTVDGAYDLAIDHAITIIKQSYGSYGREYIVKQLEELKSNKP